MKTPFALLITVSFALLLSACQRTGDPAGEASPAQQQADAPDGPDMHDEDGHDLHADQAVAPQLAEGQLWATDAPLRAAMTRVRAAVESNAPAYHDGTLQPAAAQALAASIEEDVAYMIANCKLEPEPDAALHVLIGRMINAATALKADPMSATGLPQLVSVLAEYGSTFDHPDWTPFA